jgi:adenylate cyclase
VSDEPFAAEEARAFLTARGLDEATIAEAEGAGRLHLLVLDRLLLPAPPRYTAADVAELTGIPTEQVSRFWRALGFPDVPPDEPAFTDDDLNALTTVGGLIALGFTDLDVAVQMSRVIGGCMSRIAEAGITSAPINVADADSARLAELYALTAGSTLDGNARLLEYVWRRHLQAAVRRASMTGGGRADRAVAVGFADLVGFTALSQQLSEAALAGLVSRFEELAYDTVARHGGRVVKMIGDEAMFVVDDVDRAARVALALAEAYSDDEELSDVRVGLACGPALVREGDYYGPVVNLASRIVNIARPGTVLVSDEVHAELAHSEEFAFKKMPRRYLKDLGAVRLWALVRPDDDEPAPTRAGRRRIRRPGILLPLPEAVRRRTEQAGAALKARGGDAVGAEAKAAAERGDGASSEVDQPT